MDTAARIQETIAAREAYDAIIYGQRALEAMGGREYGMTAEYGAADWAIAQFEAGILEAGIAIGAAELDTDAIYGQAGGGAWLLKRGKKAAFEALKAAQAAQKELGGIRQIRLALAA